MARIDLRIGQPLVGEQIRNGPDPVATVGGIFGKVDREHWSVMDSTGKGYTVTDGHTVEGVHGLVWQISIPTDPYDDGLDQDDGS
jgi:hypothetical protein